MSKRRAGSLTIWVYAGSVAFHVALAVGAGAIPKPKQSQVVAITLAEVKKKPPEKPKPPPAPPPPPENKPPPPKPQPQLAKVAPEAKTEAPPPEAAPAADDGYADLGVAMGNTGPGIPVPAAAPQVVAAAAPKNAAPAPAATTHKVQALAPAAAEACSDPVVRPKRKVPVAPKYTMEARQAEIEGVVKIEVTVDETGSVIAARVLSGLGYGLDESALAAAKASTFEPATRCGKAVVGTAVLPFRFEAI